MNIFLLDYNLERCAQYHCDKHIVKMPTETAQLLSSAYYSTGQNHLAPYELSHYKHPQAIWCRQSIENWNWLALFGISLYNEYLYRYNSTHSAGETIIDMYDHPPYLPNNGFEYPPQCMPDRYKRNDIVEAYRAYYNGDKRHLFQWSNRGVPFWIE